MDYEDNDKMTFTARATGVGETQVFKVPYGMGVRLRLVKLYLYNEAGTATNILFFDNLTGGAVTDPPKQGDATNPLGRISAAALGQAEYTGGEHVFNQGLAFVASQGSVVVTAVVREA